MPDICDQDLLQKFAKHKQVSEGALQEQHSLAREDHAYYAGDQTYYTASVMDKGRRRMVVFNKVKPFIDAVIGFMIQLRRTPEYHARMFNNEIQQEYSEYLNGVSDYVRDNANMDHIESQQDKEMLITGYGAIDTNILYENNPDGEIRSELLAYDDVWWDPQSIEKNMLDARWVYRRKKYNLCEALKRFKGSKPEDFDRVNGDDETGFVYNPEGGEYDKISFGFGEGEENLVEVYYYQWWELETYYRAENPLFKITDPQERALLAQVMAQVKANRESMSEDDLLDDYFDFDPFAEFLIMTPSIKRDMKTIFDRFDLKVEYQEHLKRVYYTSVLSTKKVFMKFKSPDQQGFTIKFKTSDYDFENHRWFGMVASLKEPARYSNKSFTEILYVIASNSKGGVMYEESAVEDPARFEQQWATTKSAIKVMDGAISGSRIAPKAQAALPNGYEQVLALSDRALGEVTGINKEFLGSSENKQVSALLEAQRINQVTAVLAGQFDSITLFQKEQARMMISFIRILAENSTGRLVRIIGPDGAARFEELAERRLAEEYDVDIGEAPTTATQKRETTTIMLQMADRLASMGQNIYPVVVNYLPIKQSDKQRLLDALTPPEPDPQALAQQQAEQAQVQQALVEAQQARTAKDIADAQLKLVTAQSKQFDNEETAAKTDNTQADTLKKLAETEQTQIENNSIVQQGVENIDLVI